MNVHPHPGPLPQERENRHPFSRRTSMYFAANDPGSATAIKTNKFSRDTAWLSLSPGERVGVRAGIGSNSIFLA